MRIRAEIPNDRPAIRTVHLAAFHTSVEANLVDALRAQAHPLVSLVALCNGAIAGHILFSPVKLSGHPQICVMGLAPMGVMPEQQRKGIGSALVRAGLEECRRSGADAVVVLGYPDYYPRFGFTCADMFGIRCEYNAPREAFMALELRSGALAGASGVACYHPVFRDLEEGGD